MDIRSRSVAWWPVHEWVQKYLEMAGDYPPAGTPAWCELADNDRRKWAAVLDAGQHHALRVETAQEQHTQASHDVSAAADWSAIAQEIRNRNDFHARSVDTGQSALAQASRDISAAADWSAIARNTLQRNGVYIPRRIA